MEKSGATSRLAFGSSCDPDKNLGRVAGYHIAFLRRTGHESTLHAHVTIGLQYRTGIDGRIGI